MLLGILYRLPCCRRAVQFKSVSKGWLSVISNPYFIRRFMDHHCHCVCKFTLVFQNTIELNVNTYIRLVSYDHNDDPSFKFDPRIGLEFLDFLPVLSLHYPVCIQASFNDLLLVCTQVPKASFFEYYICNPFTKHWLKLPPIPTDGTRTRVMIGFLCDPCICDSDSDNDREQGCITNAHYRFMVQIFSSETNEWRNSVISSPRKLNLNPFMPIACYAGVIACNGMLHWVCVKDKEIKGFVVFDPFNDSEQCHYIHPPIDLSLRHYVSLGLHHWVGGSPNMYDTSGSAHFINKCDNVIVIHRNRDPAAGPVDQLQVCVRKVRNKVAGTIGDAFLLYSRVTGEFMDIDEPSGKR
ncbi:twinkle like protein [Quercus suber]|uniref:Twinkle like protein n=1 Tax=Quercus suber TaxID=58331 RepID=A0AAW0I4W2_QUESU